MNNFSLNIITITTFHGAKFLFPYTKNINQRKKKEKIIQQIQTIQVESKKPKNKLSQRKTSNNKIQHKKRRHIIQETKTIHIKKKKQKCISTSFLKGNSQRNDNI